MNIVHNFELIKELVACLVKDSTFRLKVTQNPQLAFEGYGISPVEKTRLIDLALRLNNRSLALNSATTHSHIMGFYTANPWG